MWLVSIKGSFQGLLEAIKIIRIIEELMEIWLNEVCDTRQLNFHWLWELLQLLIWIENFLLGCSWIVLTLIIELIQIWFFLKAPNKILVLRLYLQMRLSLLPVNSILTLIFWHWFGIANEHYSSFTGTSTYSPITQKLLFIPITYLVLWQMRLGYNLSHSHYHKLHSAISPSILQWFSQS